jgi:ATPase subunit of ABC transporter with duplicated ATPase domains
MAQYIYTMNRVGKIVPPKRQILADISLSFYPGAKIGVLGLNGAGKSTLLRIMAGVDTEIEGEARPQAGIRVGYLQQEPQLDATKDVRGNVEEAVADVKEAMDKLEAIYAAYAEPDADFDKLAAEQAKLEAVLQASDGHELERHLEVAADALRLPPWDADVTKLSGGERRRVALCRLLLSKPDMILLDEPTNHLDAESVAWLERFLAEYSGTVIAVTHDLVARAEGAAPGPGGARGGGPPAHHQARTRMGAQQSQGAPRQEQGARGALRGAELTRVPGTQRDQRDLHPTRPASRRVGDRGRRPAQGLR